MNHTVATTTQRHSDVQIIKLGGFIVPECKLVFHESLAGRYTGAFKYTPGKTPIMAIAARYEDDPEAILEILADLITQVRDEVNCPERLMWEITKVSEIRLGENARRFISHPADFGVYPSVRVLGSNGGG